MTELRSAHLFTLTLDVDSNMTDVGETPYGRRRIATVKGGTFEGEELRGTVLPSPGGDWLLQRRDGILMLDVRLTLGFRHHDRLLPHDANLRRITTESDQFAIECLALADLQIERHVGAERDIGDIGGRTNAAPGPAGLDQHGPSLRRRRRVQWASYLEVAPSVLDRVHLGGSPTTPLA